MGIVRHRGEIYPQRRGCTLATLRKIGEDFRYIARCFLSSFRVFFGFPRELLPSSAFFPLVVFSVIVARSKLSVKFSAFGYFAVFVPVISNRDCRPLVSYGGLREKRVRRSYCYGIKRDVQRVSQI